MVLQDDTAQGTFLGVFADRGEANHFIWEIADRFPKDTVLMAYFPFGWRFD